MKNFILLLLLITATVALAAPFKHMGNPLVMGSKGVPDDSALVELKSTTQGFLPSRMTEAERDLIINPATGLQIFNTTAAYTQVYDGASWISLGVAGGGFTSGSVMFAGATGVLTEDNTNFFWDDTNNILQLGAGVPNTSSIFETFSTTKGTRPCPSMTEVQRDAIGTPASGLCIYNTDTDKLNVYNSTATAWESAGGGLDAWVTGFSYQIGNIVHESDKIYRAATIHTSGVFATDLANGDWVELSDDLNREADLSVADNAITRWDGTGGDDVQTSGVSIDDSNNVTGSESISVGTDLYFADASGQIRRDTADAADNQDLAISAGGDSGPSRSGSLRLSGNESVFTGDILLALGDNAAANIDFTHGAALTVGGQMDSNGKWTLGDSGGAQVHQINGDIAISQMTTNSVPYIGAAGLLTENNAGFNYDGDSLTLSDNGATTLLDLTQAGSGTTLNINNSGSGDFIIVNTTDMVLDNAGNLGLGIVPNDTLDVVGTAQIDNIGIDGNTISSRDTNGNIANVPNGTGIVTFSSEIRAEDYLALAEIVTPANVLNYGQIYPKSDDKLYFMDGAGTEHEITGNTGTAADDSLVRGNVGFDTSVAASALTINLKQKNGSSDPDAVGTVDIAFRNAVVTNGGYVVRSATAATSIVVPSGATLGSADATEHDIFLYALDNVGTVELAVSGFRYDDESVLYSTTAIGVASDVADVIYSTTARTNLPMRYLGRLKSTQATAGTWATAISNEYSGGFDKTPKVATITDIKTSGTAGGGFTSAAWQPRVLNTVEGDTSIVTLTNGTTGTDGTANRFILGPGTYSLIGSAPGYNVDGHKLRLYDHTAAAAIGVVGGNAHSLNSGSPVGTRAHIKKTFTLDVVSTLGLEHRSQTTQGTDGFGKATSFDVEAYAEIIITKLK